MLCTIGSNSTFYSSRCLQQHFVQQVESLDNLNMNERAQITVILPNLDVEGLWHCEAIWRRTSFYACLRLPRSPYVDMKSHGGPTQKCTYDVILKFTREYQRIYYDVLKY